MILIQEQTHRSIEQNREPEVNPCIRAQLIHIYIISISIYLSKIFNSQKSRHYKQQTIINFSKKEKKKKKTQLFYKRLRRFSFYNYTFKKSVILAKLHVQVILPDFSKEIITDSHCSILTKFLGIYFFDIKFCRNLHIPVC